MILKVKMEHNAKVIEHEGCEVERIVTVSNAQFDNLLNYPHRPHDVIRENNDCMHLGTSRLHGILVLFKGRPDGILIDSDGTDYAQYAGFVPNAKDILLAQSMTPEVRKTHEQYLEAALKADEINRTEQAAMVEEPEKGMEIT